MCSSDLLLAGATPHYLHTLPENSFALDYAQLPDDVWQRTQLVYVCSPGNPTGRVMTMEEWERLFALSDRYGFVTIATDAADYPPGTTVMMTGRGFVPGEWVNLSLEERPALDDHPLQPVQADDKGQIVSTEFVPNVADLNVRFYLRAEGQQSGRKAETTFTDAPGFADGAGTMSVTPTTEIRTALLTVVTTGRTYRARPAPRGYARRRVADHAQRGHAHPVQPVSAARDRDEGRRNPVPRPP